MNKEIRVLGALLAVLAAGCTTTPPAAPKVDWPQFLAGFEQDYYAADPPFAVSQGRHEFDGRLPDWSAAGLRARVEQLKAARQQAKGYADAELTPPQRFERQYLLARIDSDLFWIEEAELPFSNPAYYLFGGLDPSVYLTRPYAPLPARMQAFIAYARAIPAATAQIRQNLRTPLPRTFVEQAQRSFEGYAAFYRDDLPKIFAEVKDPVLQADLKAAIQPAARAMQNLADWMKEERPRATEAFAIGKARFVAMLRRTEAVTTPLDELQAIGRADLARNLAALEDACREYAPTQPLDACVSRANKDKPRGGPVKGARAQLDDLRRFIVDKKLVSIPGTERALVEEAPPFQRWNFAYIDIPGPYDKGMPSVYYIAPPDPTWSKADQEDYLPGKSDLLFTSVHEVWPGHFLQYLHANRSPSRFGQVFVGYAFSEGWAHYAEEMMWEAGLGAGKPEIHIGQLSNALLRNVRFLCAIGLHTEGMTVETCERMFREQAFQDPGNARQQAARGTYDPGYLNYTLGKLMIRKLRADWTATRGGREAWGAFHDQLLSYGGPPLPLLREQMLGTKEGNLF